MAPGQQVQRPAHLLRQQDGPHRGRLRAHGGHDPGPPRRAARRDPAAHRRRVRVPGRHRPARGEGARLVLGHGRGVGDPRRPRRHGRRDRGRPPPAHRRGLQLRRRHHGEVPGRGAHHGRRPQARPAHGHPGRRRGARPVRVRLQEQGRPAHARRRGRLPALSARPAPDRGAPARSHRGPDGAQGRRQRALLGPGLQNHDRPLRRQAHLHPGLFGHPGQGRLPDQHDQGQEGAGGPHPPDARQPPRGQGRRLRRRHRGGRRPQEHDDGRHPLGPRPPDPARVPRRSPSR